MAKHDVNFGVNKTLGGAAFFTSAIAAAAVDTAFFESGIWFISALIAGLVGWGIAQSEPGAGGMVVVLAALVFAFTLYMKLG